MRDVLERRKIIAMANAAPVAAMANALTNSRPRRSRREARRPMPSVTTAVPNSADVATMPIWNGVKPSSIR
jgi:hypothetical protein